MRQALLMERFDDAVIGGEAQRMTSLLPRGTLHFRERTSRRRIEVRVGPGKTLFVAIL